MMTLPDRRPDTVVASLLAALATWVTLLSWTPFAADAAGFTLPLFGAFLFVAVAGVALRWARLSPWLVALLQVAGLLLWLQHRLAGGTAVAGLLPTPDSVRAMLTALRTAVEASQTYSAPVPADVVEFYPLLIVAGCCTAVLVDLLAVGLRRAPLAGLPLLAAYTAPVSILDGGVSWVKFAAAALCYLFLIAAGEQQRLTRWGHRLTPPGRLIELPGGQLPGQAVWSSARTIGVTATALAVVAPLLLPTFHATLLPGGGSGGGGGGGVTLTNPMASMHRDLNQGADFPLVTVRTTQPDPSYLRLTVLDSFDGNAWRPSTRDIPATQRARGALPAPTGLLGDVASRSYLSDVIVEDRFKTSWLPAPYPTTSLDAPGDWRYDTSTMDFVSADDDQTAAGQAYRLRSLVLRPTARQLVDATAAPLSVYNPATKVPSGLPGIVRRLADRVTAGKTSKFEQAVALQDFFRSTGGFEYDTARPEGTSSNDLVTFLSASGKDGRRGYCEQFATAMALMGRVEGIPSRVVVGFLEPTKTGRDTYVYSSHDLHAWPEMYFGGVGWVRFEPTPATRTGSAPGYTDQRVTQPESAPASAAPTPSTPARRPERQLDQTTAADRASTGTSFPVATVAGWAGGLLLLLLLVLGPRGLRSLLRSRRWSSAAGPADWVEAGWQELRDTATDLGLAWDDRVTLRHAATSLASRFGRTGEPVTGVRVGAHGAQAAPEAWAALQRLLALLERARYARSLPEGATDRDEVRAAVATCVAAMQAGAGRRQRLLATWLPASLLDVVRGGRGSRSGERAGTVLAEGVDRTVRT